MTSTRYRQRLQFEALESRQLLATLTGEGEWIEVNDDAAWDPRAGLQVVEIENEIYLLGGRTPLNPATNPGPAPSQLWSDVWTSDDYGETWEQIKPNDDTSWAARAYFQAVTMEVGSTEKMFILGGQDFITPTKPESTFFNDVWSSADGISWTEETPDAGWEGRAGLSSVVFNNEIYVLGGSVNDDSAVIGGPPERIYFNDVWKSADGSSWTEVTDAAPWAPRAGAQVVVKDDHMYLLGGEDGFTCQSGDRCPPYYNDVWRTMDGENWELVTSSAAWKARPGHQVQVVQNQFVLFGGFGLSPNLLDPFRPSNPMDVWTSPDGAYWVKVSDSPWNATDPAEIKYDFDSLVLWNEDDFQPDIYTFGGDRETFDFNDPTNYLNVDNDVWQFSPPACGAPFATAAANVYLQCDVVVGDADGSSFALDTGHYKFLFGSGYVGMRVTGTEGLNPADVEIRDSSGQLVPVENTNAHLGANESYVIAELTNDVYEVTVRGQSGSTGDAVVEISLIGDVDGSGKVNLIDKLAFLPSFGETKPSPLYKPSADATQDGSVGVPDLIYLQQNWSTKVPKFDTGFGLPVRRGNPLDVDRNGRLNLQDVLSVVNKLQGNEVTGIDADANDDGSESLQDALWIVRAIHETARFERAEIQAAEIASGDSPLSVLDPRGALNEFFEATGHTAPPNLEQIAEAATDLVIGIVPWERDTDVESELHTSVLEALEEVALPIDGNVIDQVLENFFQ